jgi:uncharacterized membrane protein
LFIRWGGKVPPRSFDLIAVVLWACAGVAILVSGANMLVIQAIFALPLILFLPGYAFTAALFPASFGESPPESTPSCLNRVERMLLALGLSLALTALGGYVLNVLPSGLNRTSWAIALGSLTVLAAGVAYFRRPAISAGSKGRLDLNARPIVMLVLALLLAFGALSIATSAAVNQAEPGFTQLWMLPSGRANSLALRLGVRSHERSTLQYRLEVQGMSKTTLSLDPITLNPGAAWETTLILPGKHRGALSVLLIRTDRPRAIYRQVTWKPVS